MKPTELNQAAPVDVLEKRAFLNDIGGILNLPNETLLGPETLLSYDWDSLAVITFQTFLDERFGIRIPYAQIASCRTFNQLFEVTRESLG